MESNTHPENVPSLPELPSLEAAPSISPPPKNSRQRLITAGIISFIGLCVCIGVCVFFAGTSYFEVTAQKESIAQIVDTFMQAMTHRDIEQAYSLFSTRAKRQIAVSKFEELTDGSNFALFEGYKKVEVQNIKLVDAFNTNPDVPQGKVANVSGQVTYEGDYLGSFQATLEKEAEGWRLHFINVTVPPHKLEEYVKKTS